MSDSPSSFIAPDPAELAPLFPGYEIEGLIATGGMGAVYRAVQKSLDRAVAIKILPHELSADEGFRSGFEAEAKAMARLNHPNLIGVYDFGEVAGMLYIIMEFVPGCSLFHSSHGTAIDPSEVVRIVSGICSGLAHAHDNGIIHRDIKPANILLDLGANPKIGDFGLARPTDRQIQEGEEIFGTPHYTAPEVINSPHSVDHRSDIFSLGVILHELLTGRLPADDHRAASAISHCDPRFDAIIRRATDPLPANRYSSAHEIERELNTISTTAGPRALKTSVRVTPRSLKRTKLKQPSGNAGLVIVLILLIAAAVAYIILSKKKHTEKNPVPEASVPLALEPEKPASPPVVEKQTTSPLPIEPSIPEPQPAEDTGADEPEPPVIKLEPEDEPAYMAPKSDVPAFLERARAAMLEKAAPLIRTHDLALTENTSEYGQALSWVAQRISHKPKRDDAANAVEAYIKECKGDNNRIPEQPSDRLANLSGHEEIHAKFLKQQQDFDNKLADEVSALKPVYLLGIEKEIERLQPTEDPGAIRLLKQEMSDVREDADYFNSLIFPD